MSSVDYDPVKAHEYYERHKKKTANRSTKGMSQTKKEQWAYAKSQINDDYSARSKALTENSKTQRTALSEQAQTKIKAIRNRMKGLSTEQKQALKSQIAGIRATLKSDKQQVTDMTKATREGNAELKEADLNQAYARIKSGK